MRTTASVFALALVLAACGSSAGGSGGSLPAPSGSHAHPQVVQPTVGAAQSLSQAQDPAGDPNAHAMSLAEVKRQLAEEQKVAQELNSLNAGQGFVFPIQPLSIVEPPSTWEPDAGAGIATAGAACGPAAVEGSARNGRSAQGGSSAAGACDPGLRPRG